MNCILLLLDASVRGPVLWGGGTVDLYVQRFTNLYEIPESLTVCELE